MPKRDEIQKRLNEFYANALDEAKSQFAPYQMAELSAPLLVAASDAYLSAPVRIMFAGKETNGWWGTLARYYAVDDSIDLLTARYERQMSEPSWRGRFFQTLSYVAAELTEKPSTILYNNLMKMDWKQAARYSRTSIDHSDALTTLSQKLIRFEVALLKPDVIIFACGASYDRAIKATFPEYATDEVIVPRALWRFRIGETICFRSRHPNAMKSKGFLPTAHYYATIIQDVKNRFGGKFGAGSGT